MTVRAISQRFAIDDQSSTPKYKQIVNAVVNGIEKGIIQHHEKMPSITDLSGFFNISRDTAEKAYNLLKSMDILDSVPGKGFYIKNMRYQQKRQVLLLIDERTPSNQAFCEALTQGLGPGTDVECHCYNDDFWLLEQLLYSTQGNFSKYIIVPPAAPDTGGRVRDLLRRIDQDKLLLLRRQVSGLACSGIFENIERNMYEGLLVMCDRLRNYQSLMLVLPVGTEQAMVRPRINGFKRFCIEQNQRNTVASSPCDNQIQAGTAYVCFTERDLVALAKCVRAQGFQPGKDVGIVSFADSSLNSRLLDGITFAAADCQQMGELAVRMIQEGEKGQRETTLQVEVRNSL
jgi:DNA-binding transcriptional regulator YhcF (GntR family)